MRKYPQVTNNIFCNTWALLGQKLLHTFRLKSTNWSGVPWVSSRRTATHRSLKHSWEIRERRGAGMAESSPLCASCVLFPLPRQTGSDSHTILITLSWRCRERMRGETMYFLLQSQSQSQSQPHPARVCLFVMNICKLCLEFSVQTNLKTVAHSSKINTWATTTTTAHSRPPFFPFSFFFCKNLFG